MLPLDETREKLYEYIISLKLTGEQDKAIFQLIKDLEMNSYGKGLYDAQHASDNLFDEFS